MPCILRRCGVLASTPHSSGFARLASGAFYFAIQIVAVHPCDSPPYSQLRIIWFPNTPPPTLSLRTTANMFTRSNL
ncbi:MAG: hypothetical protein NTY64_04410 [Deltaproteobacteria bacterium]|nr:hypothetical protein [Deltaproteobacteria bacterium]